MKRLLCALVVAVTVASVAGIMAQTPDPGRGGVWVTGTSGGSGDITSVVAGAGMTGGGTEGDVTLNVIGTADAITVSADAVTIASTYVGQTSITTLGTVATGTWQATDVGVAHGGTGVSSLTANSLLLGAGTSAVTFAAPGTSGNVLTSNGTVWASAAPSAVTSLDTGTVAYAGRTITVDTGGTLNVVLASAAGDDFTIDTDKMVIEGDTGRVSIGGAPDTYAAVTLRTAFTSSGTSSVARGLDTDRMTVTGVSGDTTHVLGSLFSAAMTVQNVSETVADVAQVMIDEPLITKGASATISNSSSLKITGAATEATNNYALWVDSGVSRLDGNVGIGTATPTRILHVVGDITLQSSQAHMSDGYGLLWGDNGINGNAATDSLRFDTGGGQRMGINSAGLVTMGNNLSVTGNVGIGTAAPGSKLDISVPAGAAQLTIQAGTSDSVTGEASIKLISRNSGSGSSPPAEIRNIWGGSNDSDLAFYTTTDGATMVEHMRIDDVGNVGIGTASPATLLDVSKNQNADTAVTIRNVGTGTAAQATLKFGNVNGDAVGRIGSLGSGFTTANALQQDGFYVQSQRQDLILSAENNGDIRFWNGAAETMVVEYGGNVGIGVTDPDTALEVNGVAKATSGFTSGIGDPIHIAEYNQVITATDITNGYVTVTTTIAGTAIRGLTAGIYDVTTSVFHAHYEGGYLTDAYGGTNYVRSSLGATVAASDVYKVIVWWN